MPNDALSAGRRTQKMLPRGEFSVNPVSLRTAKRGHLDCGVPGG
jgi:hypothetical protein